MKLFGKFFSLVLTVAALVLPGAVMAQEGPQELVKRISEEVLAIAKADKDIQSGNQKRVLEVVEEKILPYVDFQRMTTLAAGRYWRQATPEQQKQLVNEFRRLLVYTYSGAIAQIRDQRLDFKPMRGSPSDNEVEVRSQVVQPRGEPIQLDYRLEKTADGWKIYDMNILGAWLVETYRGNFSNEINRNGIDGLIKALDERNKKLGASATRGNPRS
ncbi:MAG: MlaC/ttg2D family ABC transporter substrate-binding protein [Noviherbaspirillum sp.]